MARAITTYPFETLSGRIGNAVWSNYPDGPRVREYVRPRSPQTPLQVDSQRRTERVSRTWALLDGERVGRWRAFASSPRLWQTGKGRTAGGPGRAYNLFFKLASQACRIDPTRDLLAFDPPVRRFMGDGVVVSISSPWGRGGSGVEGVPEERERSEGESTPTQPSPRGEEPSALLFAADRANAPGVVTELRAQRLRHAHCLPSPDKYRFAAFHAFVEGEGVAVPMPRGVYACAYAFYDAQTGQQTELVEIGVATVG